MPGRWFRISFSRNAFLRLLAERGLSLDTLTLDDAEAMMAAFYSEHKPQHAEIDAFSRSDRKRGEHRVRTLRRRMQRHDHPESTLSLVLEYTDAGVTSRALTQT